MKGRSPLFRIMASGLVLFITVNCSFGKIATSINTPPAAERISTPSFEAPTIAKDTATPTTPASSQPLTLIGTWKIDDMRAADRSWSISYSLYIKFTDTKQYVYHGEDAFNNNQPSDEGDILSLDDSTMLKKIVYIPNNPEYMGKFQKWTWHFEDGKVLFEIYNLFDSQELALQDKVINSLATGIPVKE